MNLHLLNSGKYKIILISFPEILPRLAFADLCSNSIHLQQNLNEYLYGSMIDIGHFNELEVKTIASNGAYLTDGEDDVLLPNRYIKERLNEGDNIKVFIYLDNENRPIATTEYPYAELDEFVFLKVKDVTNAGAFLDWGISKDLFVAFSEQRKPMSPGEYHLVYIFMDDRSGRIAATSRWSQYISKPEGLSEGDEVQLLIAEKTDLGWRAIIDNRFEGLLYDNEIFEELEPGNRRRGYIRLIRPDNKIDLRLQKEGYSNIENTTDIVLHYLKENNGVLKLGDKSPAEEIYRILKISKKTFKKSIGALYKKRAIIIEDEQITLVQED